MFKQMMGVTIALCGTLSTTGAHATGAEPQWNMGAGIGYQVVGVAAGGLGVGALPAFGAMVEYRLLEPLWLGLELSGGIQHAELGESHYDTRSGLLSLHLRHLVYRGVVDLSWYTALSGSVISVSSSNGDSEHDQIGGGVQGALGFAVERELASGIAMRFATDIAQVAWHRSSASTPELDNTTYDQWSAAFAFTPKVEFRAYF